MSASRALASAMGSACGTWAPIFSPAMASAYDRTPTVAVRRRARISGPRRASRVKVDRRVVRVVRVAGHLGLDQVRDLHDLAAGRVPVLRGRAVHLDEDVVRVLRAALQPGAGERVPELGELVGVVDDLRLAG